MSSCLIDTVNDVVDHVKDIDYDWGALGTGLPLPTKLFQAVNIWNDQIAREVAATGYTFVKPACFVEMTSEEAKQLADNVTLSDAIWRLHIVDTFTDPADDEGSLRVMQYRDILRQILVGYQPVNCSTMFFAGEMWDYTQASVYHLIVQLKCCFKDTKGSIYDPDQTKVIYKDAPTDAELEVGLTEHITATTDPLVTPLPEQLSLDIITTLP